MLCGRLFLCTGSEKQLDVNGDGVLSLGELQLLTNENLNDDDNYADDAPNSE